MYVLYCINKSTVSTYIWENRAAYIAPLKIGWKMLKNEYVFPKCQNRVICA